jgi:hypothetical protein
MGNFKFREAVHSLNTPSWRGTWLKSTGITLPLPSIVSVLKCRRVLRWAVLVVVRLGK